MSWLDSIVGKLKVDDDDEYYDEDDYSKGEEDVAEKTPVFPMKKSESEDDEEDKPVKRINRTPQGSKNARRNNGSMEVVRIEPTTVEDGKKITDYLLENKVVFLNLEGIKDNMILAQRIIDYTAGATYAIDGTLQQMSSYTFVLAPPAVNVSGDFHEVASSGYTSVTL